jgi:diacylglycerol kinase
MLSRSWSIIKSFYHACYGIFVAFRDERNMRLHGFATFIVLIMMILLKVSTIEFLIVLLNITFVWVAELVNTSIEESFDLFSTEQNTQIKVGKDVAAGAVLVASVGALITGLVIFGPKVFALLSM